MAVDVLVVIDFGDANQTQRNAFAEQIGAHCWAHHPRLPNAYVASFENGESDEMLVSRSETHMREAVEHAGIDSWDATCIVGERGWVPGVGRNCTW